MKNNRVGKAAKCISLKWQETGGYEKRYHVVNNTRRGWTTPNH